MPKARAKAKVKALRWCGIALAVACGAAIELRSAPPSPIQWPLPRHARPAPEAVWIAPPALARAHAGRETIAILDLREEAAFRAGHLPGAVHFPARLFLGGVGGEPRDEIRRLLGRAGATGSELTILYGADNALLGGVARGYWSLLAVGVAHPRVLEGGMRAWVAAGLPLERTAPTVSTPPTPRTPPTQPTPPTPPTPQSFAPHADDDIEVSAPWLLEHAGDDEVQVLDVRDARGWERFEMPPDFAAGHIARSLPFTCEWFRDGQGRWLSPTEILRRLASFGPRPGDPIDPDPLFVVYGTYRTDERPWCAALVLASAGLRVRVFADGWEGWKRQGYPVARIASVEEVRELLSTGLGSGLPQPGVVVLDLREARDFALGHLPGAVNLLPGHDSLQDVVTRAWPAVDRRSVPCVLYCYGPNCIRSWRESAAAAAAGFHTVWWLRDGFPAWQGAGLPVFAGPSPQVLR